MRLAKLAAVPVFVCLAAATAFAAADLSMEVPKLFGSFDPKVGAWAEYEITEKGVAAKSLMRMAIVGKEGDAWWYEVTNTEGDATNVIKMLVKGSPNNSDNIVRLIVKSGDGPPTEMPRDFVVMGRKMATSMFSQRSGMPAVANAAETVKVEDLGEKTVEVPAGAFKGMGKRIVDSSGKVLSDYVFNPDFPPFGIVVSQSEQTTMKLKGYGTDAKTAITGEPVKLNAPRGMPDMPRGMPPGMENMMQQQQMNQQRMMQQQ